VGVIAAHAAQTQAQLILAAGTAKPGDTILAGVRFRMNPGWHIYWRNPGGTGMATAIDWNLPPGITAGPIRWPAPRKQPEDDLTTYFYEGDITLVVPFQIAANVPAGPLTLKGKASWLECSSACVPGDGVVEATLTIGTETAPSKDAALVEAAVKALPGAMSTVSAQARWEKPAAGAMRALLVEWNSSGAATEADFFPDASDQFEVQPATELVDLGPGKIRLRKLVKLSSGNWPAAVSGVVFQKSGATALAFEGTLAVAGGGSAVAAAVIPAAPAASGPVAAPASPAPPALGLMLLYAFLGGLILNIMPCVLPVIALKILGFVGQAGENRARVRALGLLYALGVLASFLALALLVVGVKAAGHKAGWGMQFGSPEFVVGLIVLVTLVALNLFGVFEVNAGGKVLGAAGAAASKHGASGAFFNGVLATILATPCTAPFLGAALGFAFAQPPAVIVLFFLVAGAGLAAPYVALSWEPAWLKLLPKPGAWMERFKIAMGFPMLATMIWLMSLLPAFYGPRAWWMGIFLVMVGCAAWIYGQFIQRGTSRPGLALTAIAVILVGGYFRVVERELDWRSPIEEASVATGAKSAADAHGWQPWSPAAVAEARAAGRPVLVDFTADWCAICQLNKRVALDAAAVKSRLAGMGAVALLGDYTRRPDVITDELTRYGRAGVPLVLVYPRDPSAAPLVLPEALTPGIVLEALEKAAR